MQPRLDFHQLEMSKDVLDPHAHPLFEKRTGPMAICRETIDRTDHDRGMKHSMS